MKIFIHTSISLLPKSNNKPGLSAITGDCYITFLIYIISQSEETERIVLPSRTTIPLKNPNLYV
jgi:hypothetical protein